MLAAYDERGSSRADAAAVALRYHNVYGPGMPRDTPYSGVAAMFRSSLERGEPPQVYEDGGQQRDFVHVADVARANLAAVRSVVEEPAGRYAAYNVASGHPVTILDVARLVGQGLPDPVEPQVTGGYRLGDVRHIVASPARASADLGFSAEMLPEQGLPAFATAGRPWSGSTSALKPSSVEARAGEATMWRTSPRR